MAHLTIMAQDATPDHEMFHEIVPRFTLITHLCEFLPALITERLLSGQSITQPPLISGRAM